MVFNEGVDFRRVRRPGEGQGEFRSPVRFADVPDIAVVDGLVAWYRFADNSNTAIDYTAELDDDRFADTTAFDATVNGASFQLSGGANDVVSEQNPSGAYDFDGVDDFIDIGTTGEFQGTSPYTVSFFLSLDSKPQTGEIYRIFGNGFDGTNHPFHIEYDNRFRTKSENIIVRRFDASDAAFLSGGSLPLSTLTHIAVTHDSNDTFEIFVNGVSRTRFQLSIQPVTNNARELIGTLEDNGTLNRFTDGVFDDLRIYNRDLSASEINQIYTNTDPDQQ
jgi:hypothetical protein